MKFLFLFPFLWQIIFAEVKCPLSCNSTTEFHVVEEFCANHNATMVGRCCFAATKPQDLIGLDLQSCNITVLDLKSVVVTDVKIMDLRNNNLKVLTIDQTRGMLSLNDLYLPSYLDCPGGADAWNISIKNIDEHYRQCHIQENPCLYLNVSCSVSGKCLHEGPGYAKCVCNPGCYGYKCMQSGKFPSVAFSVSLILSSAILSVFSWHYLRKHATDPQKTD